MVGWLVGCMAEDESKSQGIIALPWSLRLTEVDVTKGSYPKVSKKRECLKNCWPVATLADHEPLSPIRLLLESSCVHRMTAHSWLARSDFTD